MQEREKKRVQNWRAPGRSTKSSRPPEWGLPAGEGGPGYGHAWDQWFPVAQRVSPGEKWMKRILWVPRPPLTHSPSPLPPHLSTSFPTSYPQPSHLQPTPHSLPLWTPPSPTWPLIPRRESSGVSTCQFKRTLLERESPTKMSHRAHGVSKSPGPHCTAPGAQMESRVPVAAVATRGKHGGLHAVPGCPGGGAEEPVQSPQSSSCLMGTRDPGGLVSWGGGRGSGLGSQERGGELPRDSAHWKAKLAFPPRITQALSLWPGTLLGTGQSKSVKGLWIWLEGQVPDVSTLGLTGTSHGDQEDQVFPQSTPYPGTKRVHWCCLRVPPRSRLHSRAHLPSHTWPCPAATLGSLKGEQAGSVCQGLPALPALTTGRLAQPWEEGPPLRTGFSRSVATAVF